MQDLIHDSALALKAVTAGVRILEQRQCDLPVKTKESFRDIVTQLDEAIEGEILTVLRPRKLPVIGEETARRNGAHLPSGKKWYVDPLDGTVNFVHGLSWYGVSVGLMHENTFVAGAVAFPAQEELFYTMEANKSFLNERPLKAGTAELKNSLLAVSFSGRSADLARRDKEYLAFGALNDMSRGVLRTGSAAFNVCCVASGKLQAAFGFANKIWDVAGALAIARAAGCDIFVQFNPGTYQVDFVVGVKGVTREILAVLVKRGFMTTVKAGAL